MNVPIFSLSSALVLCVALSAFFSCAETAFLSASKTRMKALQQEGSKPAERALALMEQSDRLLTTVLIGNNLVNIGGTAIATVLFTQVAGDLGATLSTAVMTILVLLFGEIAPKTLAKESPENLAMRFVGPMSLCIYLLTPFNLVFGLWQKLVSKMAKPAPEENLIEAELMTIVNEAQDEGDLDADQSELLRSALELDDRNAHDIMTPRVDVTAIPDTYTIDQAEEVFLQSAYSRLPVYHDNIDHIIGVLHEKDFYLCRHNGVTDVRRMMKRAVYAPATMNVSRLMKLFQSTKSHIVIVEDEFGGTEGIVTLEDAIEELVGEIYDEHDDVQMDFTEQPDGSLLTDGNAPLEELLERFDLEGEYESNTVGGWVAEMLGVIPRTGMNFDYETIHVKVTGMNRRRVTKVTITRIPKKNTEEET